MNTPGLRKRFDPVIKFFEKYFPFTISGSAVCIASILLFTWALVHSNPYGLVVGMVGVLFVVIITTVPRISNYRNKDARAEWEASAYIYARDDAVAESISLHGISTPPFFRLHARIAGRLRVSTQAWLGVRAEAVASLVRHHTGSLRIPLYFHLPGTCAARLTLCVKDVFGLTRLLIHAGDEVNLTVRPWLSDISRPFLAEAAQGFEDAEKKSPAEIEKYYMREYMPGDRLRDINWKSSSRLSKLITRVAPQTQEKTRTITVLFRPVRHGTPQGQPRDTVTSVALLGMLKKKALDFIRGMLMQHPEYRMIVYVGSAEFILESADQLEQFTMELSASFFQGEPQGLALDSMSGEVYMFTTRYDTSAGMIAAQLAPRTKLKVLWIGDAVESKDTVEQFPIFDPWIPGIIPGPWALRNGAAPMPTPSFPGVSLETVLVKPALY